MTEKREKISITDGIQSVCMKMSEGNIGALTVLMGILKKSPREGFFSVLNLDDMNIRGEQIWLGYKDFCNQDLDRFIECAKKRDKDMIETINKNCSIGEIAVHSGASFSR